MYPFVFSVFSSDLIWKPNEPNRAWLLSTWAHSPIHLSWMGKADKSTKVKWCKTCTNKQSIKSCTQHTHTNIFWWEAFSHFALPQAVSLMKYIHAFADGWTYSRSFGGWISIAGAHTELQHMFHVEEALSRDPQRSFPFIPTLRFDSNLTN